MKLLIHTNKPSVSFDLKRKLTDGKITFSIIASRINTVHTYGFNVKQIIYSHNRNRSFKNVLFNGKQSSRASTVRSFKPEAIIEVDAFKITVGVRISQTPCQHL